jgi:hypothetical protein
MTTTIVRPSATVTRVRVVLGAFGIAMLVLGAVVLLQEVEPTNYVGILIWFVGALVIHDGILAPIIFGISLLMRKAGTRIPFVVLAIVQGALVLAAITTALFLPEAIKKHKGTNSSSILPLDYGTHLVGFYAVLVVVTGVVIAAYLVVRAKRRSR